MPKKRCQLKQQLSVAQNVQSQLEVFFTLAQANGRKTVLEALSEKQLPVSLKCKVHQKVYCNDHNAPKLPEVEDPTSQWDWSMLTEQMHSVILKSTIATKTITPSATKKATIVTDLLNCISFIKQRAHSQKLLGIWLQLFLTSNVPKDLQATLCSLILALIYKLEILPQNH